MNKVNEMVNAKLASDSAAESLNEPELFGLEAPAVVVLLSVEEGEAMRALLNSDFSPCSICADSRTILVLDADAEVIVSLPR
jgi:hypothetical protein